MRKVRAGWYTVDVVSWGEAHENKYDGVKEPKLCEQMSVDVFKNEFGEWEVSTRNSETRSIVDDPYLHAHLTAKEAKEHAVRFVALWKDYFSGKIDYYPTLRETA